MIEKIFEKINYKFLMTVAIVSYLMALYFPVAEIIKNGWEDSLNNFLANMNYRTLFASIGLITLGINIIVVLIKINKAKYKKHLNTAYACAKRGNGTMVEWWIGQAQESTKKEIPQEKIDHIWEICEENKKS